LDVDHRIAGHHAAAECLRDALVDGGDELARDPALADAVLEDEAAAPLAGLDVKLDVSELALAAGLADEAPGPVRGAPDRLLVGERIAGAGLLEADRGGDVARENLIHVLPPHGVHAQDPADALTPAAGHVEHAGAGLEAA